MLNILKPQLEQLAEVAASGESPQSTAQLTIQLISSMPEAEKILDALSVLVEDQAKFSNLMILAPKLRAHSAWFEELRKEIANIILEDDPEVASNQ